MLPGGWTHLLYLVVLAHHDRPYCNTTTYYVFGSYLQWYRDLRCPPLSSGLGDCPNNLIHSFPSPEKVPPPVYTRASYGPSTMGHIAQMAYFFRLYSPECVEGDFCELRGQEEGWGGGPGPS